MALLYCEPLQSMRRWRCIPQGYLNPRSGYGMIGANMAYHPINLGFRFILELVALYALGFWGWTQGAGVLRYLLAVLLPGAAAAVWAIFRAIEPVEPKHIVRVVPGRVRLVMELVFFALATAALIHAGQVIGGVVFGMAVILHYGTSIDRIGFLLKPG
jgi:hypothetical protein